MQPERDAERDKMRADALPLTCPVCNFFFITWEVKSFGYETRRTDFRPNYSGDNPMELFYHMCTRCRFCADQEYFSLDIEWGKRKPLEDGLAVLYKEFGPDIGKSLSAKLLYGALVGDLLQSLDLIDEPLHDRTMSYVQSFWWSREEEQTKYGDAALIKLKDTAHALDKASEDYLYTLYMIGEISRRIGRMSDAHLYFEKLQSLRPERENDSNRFLFDLAKQQMTDPQDMMPEESLNPYNGNGGAGKPVNR
jgi:uncharacterized protein (DUF2225 family)